MNARASRCRRCAQPARALRAGECWPCYFGAADRAAPSASCIACGCSDRRVLRAIALTDGDRTACANCAAIVGVRALALDELLREVRPAAGDRRGARDRRSGDRRASDGDRRVARAWTRLLIGNRRLVERRGGDDEA